jgi:pimeloyl-ACP methyl ester carboxylesterase
MGIYRRYSSYAALIVVSALAATMTLAAGPAWAGEVPGGDCQAVTLPVTLAPGHQAGQTLAGTLCEPDQWAAGPHTVDVLTNGATYNQSYWDWPVDPEEYSYVRKTLAAGRATFAYDRVGTGASSHPSGTSLTLTTDAYELHQVVEWLNGNGYSEIDSVGHSFGSIVAIQESAGYGDVSRLVVTGFLHTPNLGNAYAPLFGYPAALHPAFAGEGLDLSYLTTFPGARGIFYSETADPAVISYDQQHPDTITSTELSTSLTQLALAPPLNPSDQVTVPVLIVVGQQDALLCSGPLPDCDDPGSVRALESPYYASAPSLTVDTVPDTGHDVALHPSAGQSFETINDWIVSNQ